MAAEQYDELGAEYAEHTASSPANAYYDRPAILALAGDVAGRRVLDVGCAAGHLSARLVERGAEVTGIDVSPVMVRLARERCARVAGGRAEFHRADLAEPLDFLPDGSFDLVTASLVLHYLEDWVPPLRELRRVLRPGGALVMSVHHPGEDWRWFDRPDYFRTEMVTDEWPLPSGPREVRFYRRPLSSAFSALRRAGFDVDQLVEPMPLPECEQADPYWYTLLMTRPRFLYFRAVNPER
ncbi:Methylase involved in ubiquinone/menaquinone biosynthesis [Marinactinospora thermotolerans DSM 45154]|uniref:Methylase involved in ubiquinone/menaquinone biosynthesis n=1 Tax=Marinactinospora thermotolerans DSM 45154 TaxID=1122192 RepID=A0A1T4T6U3_9ACTN|nr:class I SAM-dependent methyltransferase [Marinactinospora thermotolerans]SKA36182.1 Methylase involved in ubiquinone/menaquinone biosynthesis [Marinactinospora thermotolerans DSM 45154]